ncbi:RagB/SusD family nutrient uptake outer membrane protein [Labilibaculum euxinus]|uniref:RagB/SusD family nutrient uptake outer membrane protein n=1 Tax=Labilibaculum euxinus TaxID=2686357 RepID=A0A7M4D287_9BACT|nr:RagB/SusD family nutrient uptake outer membrane protein [Labilibaculum euxinus]MUP36766.1 RagB/SusD family nutrient uptake outer membrane protein [Labilibaculum euxinus]MVB05971.1 RagB/SusD family nutrient uptake outer membrane protein [Labilibaculum euxinus]
MRKYNYITLFKGLVLATFAMFMAGCNDYLDVTPPSDISPESYLWDEAHLAAYTVTYYADDKEYNEGRDDKGGRIPSHYGSGGESFYFNDLATDNETTRGSSSKYVPGVWTVGSTGGDWNFSNIYALNYYLQTVVPRYEAGEISGNAANVGHYVGEGYFLRAHEYFFRLRKLGDFPIIKETLSDDQEVLVEASKRQPRNEVARFILEDLDKAIDLLTDNPDGGKVRITRKAALLLKARVALFEATWLKYHAGTPMVPNGPGWPGADKDYNSGYEFPSGSLDGEIEYFLTEAMDASKEVADAVGLVANNEVIQESEGQSVNDYYNMFATPDPSSYGEVLMYRNYSVDLGKAHSYNHYIYHGAQKGYTHQMEHTFLMQNGLPVYAAGSGYQGDDYIQDTKIDRDWRWRLFMKAPGEVKAFKNITTPETFETAPVVYKSDGKYSTSTGYMLGKGYALDYNMQLLGQDITAPVIFRAAEAYLIYIEACYVKNGTIDSKADSYWRALRVRAGVDEDYNKTIAATDLNQEALYDWGAYSHGSLVDATLYNIRRERRCELIGEGQRYYDLIRWRAMDQLNGFQIEGCKIWGPMKDDYAAGLLLADQADEKKNTTSSPALSEYLRPYQIVQSNNNYYNGLNFTEAHYLEPISIKHFLNTASDGETISTSPIYQNPGWPIVAGQGAEQ